MSLKSVLSILQDERPFTCARSHSDISSAADSSSGILLGGQKLEINLMSNWGHAALIGSTEKHIIVCLTFRHRASCILGQAFHYFPENAFYIFNQEIYFII